MTKATRPDVCRWAYDEDTDHFDTECDNAWWFEQSLVVNRAYYCPSCGGEILVERHEEGPWVPVRVVKHQPRYDDVWEEGMAALDDRWEPPF